MPSLGGVKTHGLYLELQKPQDGWSYRKASKELDNRGGRHLGFNRFSKPIWLILQKLMKLGKSTHKRNPRRGSH